MKNPRSIFQFHEFTKEKSRFTLTRTSLGGGVLILPGKAKLRKELIFILIKEIHTKRHLTLLSQPSNSKDIQFYILTQSSGDFDPEGDPGLKKPPDPSETSIRRNKETLFFDSDKNYGKKSYHEMIRSFQLLIRNEISLIWSKNVGLPDD